MAAAVANVSLDFGRFCECPKVECRCEPDQGHIQVFFRDKGIVTELRNHFGQGVSCRGDNFLEDKIRWAKDLSRIFVICEIFQAVKIHCSNRIPANQQRATCEHEMDLLLEYANTRKTSLAAQIARGNRGSIFGERQGSVTLNLEGYKVLLIGKAFFKELKGEEAIKKIEETGTLERLDDFFWVFYKAKNILLRTASSEGDHRIRMLNHLIRCAKERQIKLITQLAEPPSRKRALPTIQEEPAPKRDKEGK